MSRKAKAAQWNIHISKRVCIVSIDSVFHREFTKIIIYKIVEHCINVILCVRVVIKSVANETRTQTAHTATLTRWWDIARNFSHNRFIFGQPISFALQSRYKHSKWTSFWVIYFSSIILPTYIPYQSEQIDEIAKMHV